MHSTDEVGEDAMVQRSTVMAAAPSVEVLRERFHVEAAEISWRSAAHTRRLEIPGVRATWHGRRMVALEEMEQPRGAMPGSRAATPAKEWQRMHMVLANELAVRLGANAAAFLPRRRRRGHPRHGLAASWPLDNGRRHEPRHPRPGRGEDVAGAWDDGLPCPP